jgi:hypothetical protein
MLAFDPGFTTDARPPPYRDAAFREELRDEDFRF